MKDLDIKQTEYKQKIDEIDEKISKLQSELEGVIKY